ncbi:U3 snoRNP protein [Cryptotrichosporon argae]
MGKRKSLSKAETASGKKAKRAESESADEYDHGAKMVDPMIDVQSDESNDEDEEEGGSGVEAEDGVEDFDGPGEDDGADGVDARAATDSAGTQHASSSRPKRSLYAPPTLSELDALHPSSGTAFSLQLTALLDSTLLPNPHAALRTLLSAAHDLVLALPALPGVGPRKAAKRAGGLGWVGPEKLWPTDETKWTLGWDTPAEVLIGGGWGVVGGRKMGKGKMGPIDLIVVMPSAMFSAKDRTAFRYFHKRLHYLAVVKAALDRASTGGGALAGTTTAWATPYDFRRPIIILSAGKEQGLKHAVDIQIHAGLDAAVFPLAQLYPSKSLIRDPPASASAFASADADAAAAPAPQTSTSILHDTLHKRHVLHLHRLSQQLPSALAPFLALWHVWAARRGIPPARGGGGYVASQLLSWAVDGAALVDGDGATARVRRARGLGRGLSAYAALRAVWEQLATTDFAKTRVWVGDGDAEVPRDLIVAAFENVLVDTTGTVNVFAEWDRGEVDLLRHHARETLAALEAHADCFADIFLHSYAPTRVFDEYITVHAPPTAARPLSERAEHLYPRVAPVLRRGFADRAAVVHVTQTATTVTVGLILTAAATRVLEIGPQPESADAPAFRALWGERAELRRFKDGSIAESVVWELARPEDAARIPARIVAHLLGRHFAVPAAARYDRLDLARVLLVPDGAREAACVAGAEKLGFRPVLDAYDALYKCLKAAELPLSVLSVLPAAEALRYSSPLIPHALDLARAAFAPEATTYMPVHEVVLQFESSPRWPDDLAAIQALKLALLERLARAVAAGMRGAAADVELDAGASAIDDGASLRVRLPAGVAFRLRVHHARERVLLARALEPPPPNPLPTQLPAPPRRLVIPALARHTRRFVTAPAHHALVAPLHHRFPTYSTAARLLKRWAAAHLLAPHVPAEALELVAARAYVDPGVLGVPHSAPAAFWRTIDWLAAWDWAAEPLLVPLPEAFTDEQRTAAHAARAHADGWRICTPADPASARWFVGKAIAGRVRALARATAAAQAQLGSGGDGDPRALFRTPLESYDVVLHLAAHLPRAAEAVDPDAASWEGAFRPAEPRDVRVAFDPVGDYVRDIQRLYGDALLVFADPHGGRAVGLLWNPAKQPRALKALLGFSARPVPATDTRLGEGGTALVEVNRDAIVAEIARLGRGLVERVERRA